MSNAESMREHDRLSVPGSVQDHVVTSHASRHRLHRPKLADTHPAARSSGVVRARGSSVQTLYCAGWGVHQHVVLRITAPPSRLGVGQVVKRGVLQLVAEMLD